MAAQRKTQKKTSTRRAPVQKPDLQKEFLDKVEARLKELKPLVDEYHGLEAAVAALKGGGGSAGGAAAPTPATRGPGRPRGSRSKSSSNGRGRPKGSGKRAQEVLNEVEKAGDDGLSIPEIAKALKMNSAQYLYKVVPGLVGTNQLVKDGRKFKTVPSA